MPWDGEYQYERLPNATCFRLLEILPTTKSPTDTLLVQLHVIDIDDASKYDYKALSYSWEGAPSEAIICSRKTIKVTRNGKKALETIRHPLESKFVWMDAVCIKQAAFEYVAQKQQSSQVPVHGGEYRVPDSNNLRSFLYSPRNLSNQALQYQPPMPTATSSYYPPQSSLWNVNLQPGNEPAPINQYLDSEGNLRGGEQMRWQDFVGRFRARWRRESRGSSMRNQGNDPSNRMVLEPTQITMDYNSTANHNLENCYPQVNANQYPAFPAYPQFQYQQPPENEGIVQDQALEALEEAGNEMDGQLALVPRIYASAKSVLIWLGEIADDAEAIKNVFVVDKTDSDNAESTEALGADVLKILQRSWFERLWVVPELVMANNPELMCGPHVMPWDKFASLGADLMQDGQSLKHSASARTTWSRKVADPTILRRLVAGHYTPGVDPSENLVSVDLVMDDSSQLGGNASRFLSRAFESERPQQISRESLALALALPLLSSRKCTLSIDRVNSFVSVLTRCGVNLQSPGSGTDYRDAFLAFTQTLLSYAQSLTLWTWLRKIPGHLPGQDHQQWQKSWVLDLDTPIDWSQLPGEALADLLLSTAQHRSHDGNEMSFKAKIIDEVQQLGQIRVPGQIDFQTVKGYSGYGIVDILEGDVIVAPLNGNMRLALRPIRTGHGHRLVGWTCLLDARGQFLPEVEALDLVDICLQ